MTGSIWKDTKPRGPVFKPSDVNAAKDDIDWNKRGLRVFEEGLDFPTSALSRMTMAYLCNASVPIGSTISANEPNTEGSIEKPLYGFNQNKYSRGLPALKPKFGKHI